MWNSAVLPAAFQRSFHLLHLLDFNAGVFCAVKAEHRFFDFGGKLDRILWRSGILSIKVP